MENEWPGIVYDAEDEILDDDILLSGEELIEAEREAYAAISAVAKSAAAALANLADAVRGFRDALGVIHDDAILGQSELSE